MEFVNVIAAGVAAWIFGATWYMALAKPWMAAQGLTEDQLKGGNAAPYIVSLLMAIVVAGMMRHIFAFAAVDGIWDGAKNGLGLGLFIAAPWIVNNVMYSLKSKSLIWIDGGYPAIGCAVIGVVLELF